MNENPIGSLSSHRYVDLPYDRQHYLFITDRQMRVDGGILELVVLSLAGFKGNSNWLAIFSFMISFMASKFLSHFANMHISILVSGVEHIFLSYL